ncbi:hypothetical protein LPUS_06369 [Lasallia pustulata]|uniref:Uncharacterized protein n=1 Tax=Lasallia pustulata TaxID=136370 RepID=A0A1W5D174_9LECA|nr:hypothetical protein LPUS_06369 [Lasallia pustulata]
MNGPPPPLVHHMPSMHGMDPKIDKISSMLDGMNIRPAAHGQYVQNAKPQVKNDHNHTKYDTKTVVDSRGNLPTTYSGYMFEKAEPDFGQPKSWARVVKNVMPISNDDLLDRVRKQRSKGVSVLKQYESLTTLKRNQIDRLLEEKNKAEKDHRYEWTLASVITEERKVGRLGLETVSMKVILRRQQTKGVAAGKPDQKGVSRVVVDLYAPKRETKSQQGMPDFQADHQNHPPNQGFFGQVGNGGIHNMDGFFQQGRAPPPPPPPPAHQGINTPIQETKNQQGIPGGFPGDRQNHPQNQGPFGQMGNGGILNMDGFFQQGRAPPPPPPPPMAFPNGSSPPHRGFPSAQIPGMKFSNAMHTRMPQESQPPMFAYESDVKNGKGKKAKHEHGDHGDFSSGSGSGFETDKSVEARHKRRHSKSKRSKGKEDKRTRNWASGRSDSLSDSASDLDSVWDSDDNASIITPNSSNSSEARRDQKRHSGDHRDHHRRGSHGRSRERERERDATRRHHRNSPQISPKIISRDSYEEEPRRNRYQRYEEDYTTVEPNRSRRLPGRRMTPGYSMEHPPLGRHPASYDLPDPRDRRPRYVDSSYPRVTRRPQEFPHPADRYAEEDLDDYVYRERMDKRSSYAEAPRRRSEAYRPEVYTEGPRRRGDIYFDEDY